MSTHTSSNPPGLSLRSIIKDFTFFFCNELTACLNSLYVFLSNEVICTYPILSSLTSLFTLATTISSLFTVTSNCLSPLFIVYLKGDVGDMSKKKLVIGSVSLVVATIICTILVQVFLLKGVFISRNLYNQYKKYDKLVALENIVEEDYYQEVDQEKLILGAEKGLIQSLGDPYSEYYQFLF